MRGLTISAAVLSVALISAPALASGSGGGGGFGGGFSGGGSSASRVSPERRLLNQGKVTGAQTHHLQEVRVSSPLEPANGW